MIQKRTLSTSRLVRNPFASMAGQKLANRGEPLQIDAIEAIPMPPEESGAFVASWLRGAR